MSRRPLPLLLALALALSSSPARAQEGTVELTGAEVLLTDRVVLPAGRYTAEVAVYDPASRRGTVVSQPFVLGEAPGADGTAASSLVLGRGAMQVEGAAGADPFVVPGGTRVDPCPEGHFVKALGDRLVPCFRFYGRAGGVYRMKLDFLRAGKTVVSTGELALPVDTRGEAVVARAFGLDAFQPGDYTAVVTVTGAGGPPVTITSAFRVE